MRWPISRCAVTFNLVAGSIGEWESRQQVKVAGYFDEEVGWRKVEDGSDIQSERYPP